jgi:hypothetical protein
LKTLEASKTSQISTVLTISDHALWIKLVLLLQELSHAVPYLECLERRQLNAWNLFEATEWLLFWNMMPFPGTVSLKAGWWFGFKNKQIQKHWITRGHCKTHIGSNTSSFQIRSAMIWYCAWFVAQSRKKTLAEG